MKEMRRQKRNTYHWTLPALENTLFFMKFYRKAKATKFTSHGIVLIVFVPTKKTGPNRPSDGKFMAVLRECFRFRVLHTRRP